jgi:hypothetical protein
MPEASDRTSSTKFIFPKMQPIIKDSTNRIKSPAIPTKVTTPPIIPSIASLIPSGPQISA